MKLLDFKVFIEGIEVPVTDVINISMATNSSAMCNFNLPLKSWIKKDFLQVFPRALIHIFFSFDRKIYYLFFEGEVNSINFQRAPVGTYLLINGIDFLNYLDTIRLFFIDWSKPFLKIIDLPKGATAVKEQVFGEIELDTFEDYLDEYFKSSLIGIFNWIINNNIAFYSERVKRFKIINKIKEVTSNDVIDLIDQLKRDGVLAYLLGDIAANFPNSLTLRDALNTINSNNFSEYSFIFPVLPYDNHFLSIVNKSVEILPDIPSYNIVFEEDGVNFLNTSKNLLSPTRALANIRIYLLEVEKTEETIKIIEKGEKQVGIGFPNEIDAKIKEAQNNDEKKKRIEYNLSKYLMEEERFSGPISILYERECYLKDEGVKNLIKIHFEAVKRASPFRITLNFFPYLICGFPIVLNIPPFRFIGKIDSISHSIRLAGQSQTDVEGSFSGMEEDLKNYKKSFDFNVKEIFKKATIFKINKLNEIETKKDTIIAERKDRFFSHLSFIKYYNLEQKKIMDRSYIQLKGNIFEKERQSKILEFLVNYLLPNIKENPIIWE
mgnify:CR=1 FL=1